MLIYGISAMPLVEVIGHNHSVLLCRLLKIIIYTGQSIPTDLMTKGQPPHCKLKKKPESFFAVLVFIQHLIHVEILFIHCCVRWRYHDFACLEANKLL